MTKIVKVTSYYKDYLHMYYSGEPDLSLSYQTQLDALLSKRVSWSDSYSYYLKKVGFDSVEIVANAVPLQKSWCRDNSLQFQSLKKTLVEQLKSLKPNVIWFQDSYTYNGDFIDYLRSVIPSLKIVLGMCCSPITEYYIKRFQKFDKVVVCANHFKDFFLKYGFKNIIVLPHAFDQRILSEISSNDKYNDVVFSGSLMSDQNFHSYRIKLLEQIVNANVNLKLFVNTNKKSSNYTYIRKSLYITNRVLRKIGLNSFNESVSLLKKFQGQRYMPSVTVLSKKLSGLICNPIFGIEMFQLLSDSKIILNVHGDIASNFAANMRMFEATGVGSCLLTDKKDDLHHYFKDDEVVSYSSLDEAVEKITWLMDNPRELISFSKKGQERTLLDHTFEKRVSVLSNYLM